MRLARWGWTVVLLIVGALELRLQMQALHSACARRFVCMAVLAESHGKELAAALTPKTLAHRHQQP
jgi:hypothetical protein